MPDFSTVNILGGVSFFIFIFFFIGAHDGSHADADLVTLQTHFFLF